MEMHEVQSYTCEGAAWSPQALNTGTWLTHILAGVVMLVWALHWNTAIFRSWLTQGKARPYCAQATHTVFGLPPRWPIEHALKVVIPLVAIIINLVGAHGWRSNTCGNASPRAGHFDPNNIFRYANVWTLVAFLVSGIVDLLGLLLELPEGTQTFFTSAAFMLQSFMVVEGQYSGMLEEMVYYMMFLVSGGTAVFLLAEIAWPHNFYASCGRVYCTYMQAVWFFSTAHILYEGRIAWDSRHPLPDMAPAAFVPVPFVFLMNCMSLFMFLVFLLMRTVLPKSGGYMSVSGGGDLGMGSRSPHHHHGAKGRAPGQEGTSPTHEMVPLVVRNI